ncbi:MAG: hypothetical protein KAJ39_09395 [Gammaproteobacteria bacterium]|nr:hypothetical protein [Gammaproteobacteria bacterium]
MTLISNDSGAVFGIFLFLMLVVFAVVLQLVISPYMDGIDAGFDQEYRDKYISSDGQTTITSIKFIFDNLLVLFVIITGAIMVINRAIYHGDT